MDKGSTEAILLVDIGGLPCIKVVHPQGNALIALQGAQLLEYTPAGQQPVIWLSEKVAFDRGKALRGGVPICWPWFGAIEKNPSLVRACVGENNAPAHGWVRDRPWLVDKVLVTEECAELVLNYPFAQKMHPSWSHSVDLQVRFRVGQRLDIELKVVNNGSEKFSFSQALHTYFSVSHIDQIEIEGLADLEYTDALQAWDRFVQRGSVRISEETDRIYHQTPECIEIVDAGWQRRIRLESRRSKTCIVWNPWVAKARRLSQFAEDAWQRMLCIETANVLEDAVTLLPGESCSLDLCVSLQSLA